MAKKSGSQELLTERDFNEEIAKVAYDLYRKRGMGDGYDVEDWLKAEKIVMVEYGRLKRKEIDLMSEAANRKAERTADRRQKKT
jgi:hypothetical protein